MPEQPAPGDATPSPSRSRTSMTRTRSSSLPRGLLPALVATTCLAFTACASGSAGSGSGSAAAGAPTREAAGTGEAESAYVQADVDFMQGMIHHHAQAVVMARMAPDRAETPGLRRLASRILNSQKTEISVMSDWLRDRGESVPEIADLARDTAADGRAFGDGNPGPVEGWDEGPQMPGVLSDARMRELEEARGEEFDRLFLEYMIDHHAGAVTMVENLVGAPGAAREESVFRLASGIRADQSTEIDRMRQMLREQMFGSGSPR